MPASDPIAQLLAGTYPDPDTGELLACEAKAIAIEDSLIGREVELVEALGIGEHVAILGDVDTFPALGERVAKALSDRFGVQSSCSIAIRSVIARPPRRSSSASRPTPPR